jgi:hypothetical protein
MKNSEKGNLFAIHVAGDAGETHGHLTAKLPFDFPDLTYTMYWHPVHQKNPAHVWLRNCCNDEIKRLFEQGF